jgi:hypothetical protein
VVHICEKLMNSALYLEQHGFTQDQLSALHHFSLKDRPVRYNGIYKYFGTNKELQHRNALFAERVIFVADNYKDNKGSFSQLINEALTRWPLVW